MFQTRKARERGHADHGWLDSWHTFSFAEYYDPGHMGFRSLRVINDDRVQPGKGFGTHPHRDMEIISYVLEGELEHSDSMGNGSVIRPGDVQRMSAGTGITHSEFNHSTFEPVHFLQIWIVPEKTGLSPEYEQKFFSEEEKRGALKLIASSDGRDGSVTVNQDASLYAAVLYSGEEIVYDILPGRNIWLQMARGKALAGGHPLEEGDGAAVNEEDRLVIAGLDHAEILLFDLA
ncbi:MAG TPA: pirin family protein [Chlorobaculum sp.]|nr:pirin family protein [Chlorobaculum sp.]